MNDDQTYRNAWIDDDVAAAIEDLFSEPYAAYAAAGAYGAGFPTDWREPPADETRPVLERLRELDHVLRGHLRLLADQVPEFSSDPESLVRLRGEGFSVLISLRELHRCVPELDK